MHHAGVDRAFASAAAGIRRSKATSQPWPLRVRRAWVGCGFCYARRSADYLRAVMPLIGEHVEIERKPKLGGGGPGKIPYRRGYGGGDDGDHDGRDDFYSSRQRLRRGRIGVAICIACVSVLFVGLTMAYVIRQGTPRWDPNLKQDVYDWHPLKLPYPQ